jgi:dienelactone hydrolase
MTQITIGTMDAYLAEPGTEGRHPGVILAHKLGPLPGPCMAEAQVRDRCSCAADYSPATTAAAPLRVLSSWVVRAGPDNLP